MHDINIQPTVGRGCLLKAGVKAMKKIGFGVLLAAICVMILAACGRQEKKEDESNGYYSCHLQELNVRLAEYESVYPYLWAHISVDGFSARPWQDIQFVALEGKTSVTWQSCESLEQLEGELVQWTMDEEETEDALELLYYSFPLPEELHALDIYRALEERFSTEDLSLEALCGEDGSSYYYFTWYSPYPDEDGWYHRYFSRAPVNLFIKDGLVRGLVVKSAPDTYTDEEINLLFREYMRSIGCSGDGTWTLDEENLYWIDHEQRVTEMESPPRRFVEIRTMDALSGLPDIKRYMGIIKEADYEVSLTEDGSVLQIHLALPEKPEGEQYTCYRNDCKRESYTMTVTDKENGKVLQEDIVNYMCIRLPDTVFFEDFDGDGYVDMKVDRSDHMISAELALLEKPYYWLWNFSEGGFERKTRAEVWNRYLAVKNGLTEEEQMEKTQREKENPFVPVRELPEGAEQGDYIELIPDVLSVGEVIHIPGELGAREKLYIPRDSRYGSDSSSSIQHPNGFSYRYIATDSLTYFKWDEMNVIYCLSTYNEMGENALSEEWEDFQAEIIRCSEEICPDRVSNLRFEKYSVPDGCDLYGYSFEYDAGGKIMEYISFIRLDKTIALEIIGIREKEPNTVMIDAMRYIGASFVYRGGYPEMGMPGSLGPNVGADAWEYPWLHNLFTAAEEQFGGHIR